jgi:hypothetical protein
MAQVRMPGPRPGMLSKGIETVGKIQTVYNFGQGLGSAGKSLASGKGGLSNDPGERNVFNAGKEEAENKQSQLNLQGVGAAASSLPGMQPFADKAAPAAVESNAMQRRMTQIESDPVYNLAQAKSALQALPADVQQQYQKPIDDAYQRAIAQARQNQQRGMA